MYHIKSFFTVLISLCLLLTSSAESNDSQVDINKIITETQNAISSKKMVDLSTLISKSDSRQNQWYYACSLMILADFYPDDSEKRDQLVQSTYKQWDKLTHSYTPGENPTITDRFLCGYITQDDYRKSLLSQTHSYFLTTIGKSLFQEDYTNAFLLMIEATNKLPKKSQLVKRFNSYIAEEAPCYLQTLKEDAEANKEFSETYNQAKKLLVSGKSSDALSFMLNNHWLEREYTFTTEDAALDQKLWGDYQKGCKNLQKLPANFKWQTSSDPAFASPKAKKGGTLNQWLENFPLTLRQVGPNSNSTFRGNLDANDMALVDLHPETQKPSPSLATHWALGADKKSVYFKLDPDARWSDGTPVTANDFLYMLYFYRSPYISAGWYNSYYSKNVDKIVKHGTHTISIHLPTAKPHLVMSCNLSPRPSHFYGKLKADFTEEFDCKVAPNTGPYQITNIDKGVSITFTRNKKWWANEKKFFKNRYNPDKMLLNLRPPSKTSLELFLEQKVDTLSLNRADFYSSFGIADNTAKGYIHQIQFYNDVPRPSRLVSFNKDSKFLSEKNIRLALAHALNLDGMINNFHPGHKRAQTISTGYGAYTNTQIKARKFNLKKAAKLLSPAGFKEKNEEGILTRDNEVLTFKVFLADESMYQQFIFLQKEAYKAGIDLLLIPRNNQHFFQQLMNKDYDIAFHGWSAGSPLFGPQYWGQYSSSSAHHKDTNNITNTDSKELDKLISQYSDSISIDERARFSREIQQWLHDDCAAIPTYYCPFIRTATWRWIKFPKNYAPKTSYSLFAYSLYWIDEKGKAETLKAIENGKTFPVVDIKVNYSE